jgi:hypothetical protein
MTALHRRTLSLIRSHPLWSIVAAGLLIRFVLAFAFQGGGDIHVMRIFGNAFDRDPLHVYGLNGHRKIALWPYPPGYFPWIEVASWLTDLTGVRFHRTVQLLPILADAAIAVAIYVYLGWRGAGERLRLAGAAVVMLGPAFIAISGYHGQLDSVAILPAVLALMAWERRPPSRRALEAGLLIGLGAAIKTVPLLVALPLLASARSWREGVRLVVPAAAVPLLIVIPFYIAEPAGVRAVAEYSGLPGRGGLSLVTDPGLGVDRLSGLILAGPSGLSLWLDHNAGLVTALGLGALAAFLVRYRPSPIDGAVLLWLGIYAFSPNFLIQYLIWGLPFFIMAGYLWESAILQVLLIPALVITYLIPFSNPDLAAAIYLPSLIGLWAFWVVALATLARRIAKQRPAHPAGVQPPLVRLAVERGRA